MATTRRSQVDRCNDPSHHKLLMVAYPVTCRCTLPIEPRDRPSYCFYPALARSIPNKGWKPMQLLLHWQSAFALASCCQSASFLRNGSARLPQFLLPYHSPLPKHPSCTHFASLLLPWVGVQQRSKQKQRPVGVLKP